MTPQKIPIIVDQGLSGSNWLMLKHMFGLVVCLTGVNK